MSQKRDLDEVHDDDDVHSSPPTPKRVKKHDRKAKSKHHHQNAHIDPTWGQKYVFSGQENATTIPAGEESDFEDDTDAMAYLMSVRNQAGEIPHLLVAPKVQIGPQLPAGLATADGDDEPHDEDPMEQEEYYEERHGHWDDGPSKGYYEDGAYFDLGDEEEYEEGEEIEHADPVKATQEAYFSSLMRSYLHLRKIVNTTPPKDASDRLSSSHLTHAAPITRTSHTTSNWTKTLVTIDPHPLQLALLSKDSVFLILRVLLGGQLLQRGRDIPERTSRWLWALLARLPEPGELTHWELGCIRDLGKRAVLLGTSMEEIAALREEVEDGLGEGVGSQDQDEVEEQVLEADAPHDDSKEDQVPQPQDDLPDEEPAEDVAMELDSSDEEHEPQDLEEVRKRLLARLDKASDVEETARTEAIRRQEMNMRATINMVLTVTGDFYGQRDLLEFRDPFPSAESTSQDE